MSYSNLLSTIREFPHLCEFYVRVETFEKISVTSPRYHCTAVEEPYGTIREVATAVQDLYDELRDKDPIDPQCYVRTTWRDDYTFHYEQLLPWAESPALERVHVYAYVRLCRQDPATELTEHLDLETQFRWLILTDDVVDAIAHVRAERAWIAESEPDTILISLPEGWSEIEAGTEPEPEPQPEPKAPAPSLSSWHTPDELEYLANLPRYTLAQCLITIETVERVSCGWKTFELSLNWEEARAEVERLTNAMYAKVCDITYIAEEDRKQDYDSEIHYQFTWYEDSCQIGLLKLFVSWELHENQFALEWQDPDSDLHALQPVWIASQKINSLNSVWDRIQTESWQERQFAADWLRGGGHCYSLMIGASDIEGYHSLIEFGNDSHKPIDLSVGNWQGKAVRLI